MTLLNPGYWPETYWPSNYWNPLYWPRYNVTEEVKEGKWFHVGRRRKPTRKIAVTILRPFELYALYLTFELLFGE